MEVRGGTSFAPVLSAIHKSMLGAPDTRHFVVFLTDGQAFDGTEGAEAIATLQAASGSQSLTVHTLGFGHDHDAAFLAVLTLAGSSQVRLSVGLRYWDKEWEVRPRERHSA